MRGIIVGNVSNKYEIEVEGVTYEAVARGKFKIDEMTPTVGDRVEIDIIEENKKIVEKVDRIVSKTAHFTIYAIGGFLIISYAYKKDKKKKVLLICIAFGACYAITDELHQFFVSERSASTFDVAIDTMGVITGIVIYLIIKKIESHVKKGT